MDEEARKKEVWCLSVADSNSVTKGESLLTSVIIVVTNPGDSGNLELNSLEEFGQEITEEVEQKQSFLTKLKTWRIQFTTLELKK